MKCPKCGYDNKEGAEHCDMCKEVLAKAPEYNGPTSEKQVNNQERSSDYGRPKKEQLWQASDMDLSDILFSFKGRIGRSVFWIYNIIITAFIILPITLIFGDESGIGTLAAFILLWPTMAVLAKRYHDRNKSAWWLLIIFVPLIGELWSLIELGFLPGTDGPNDYD